MRISEVFLFFAYFSSIILNAHTPLFFSKLCQHNLPGPTTDRSARLRCTFWSYACIDGTVSSPARRKPKNPTHAADQCMTLSRFAGCDSHTSLSLRIISTVIGSLTRPRPPDLDSTPLIPVRTYSSRGIAPLPKGLPMDSCICRHLIPERYALIVRCFRPSLARKAM